MCRPRKRCGWLCMHKRHQAGSVLDPSDTVLSQWHYVVEHKLKVEYLTGPSDFSKNTSLWYIIKTTYYWVNRRLPLIQLSCSIEISNNCRIFWVDYKMFEVRTGWWNWLMHWDISPSKVPADLLKQLFNFQRHTMQSQKKWNSEKGSGVRAKSPSGPNESALHFQCHVVYSNVHYQQGWALGKSLFNQICKTYTHDPR